MALCCFALVSLNSVAQAEGAIQPVVTAVPDGQAAPPPAKPAQSATPLPLNKAPVPPGLPAVTAADTNGWQLVTPGYDVSLKIPPE